jgi:hypothetical protein
MNIGFLQLFDCLLIAAIVLFFRIIQLFPKGHGMSNMTLKMQVRKWAEESPTIFPWAIGLPVKTLDEEATEFIKSGTGDPTKAIENANPFNVSTRLSEIVSFFELISNLRAEAFSKETALIGQVLSEKLAMETAGYEESHSKIALESDWKSAGNLGGAPLNSVSEVFRLHKENRNIAHTLRTIPGHPANLLEQLKEIRTRYAVELSTLLTRAESVRLVLKESFGIIVPSLITKLPAIGSPIPDIAKWLRIVSEGLEKSALNSRVVTKYRFLKQDNWVEDGDLTAKFSVDGVVECSFTLSKAKLGIGDNEVARILEYGVAPTYGQPQSYLDGDQANREAAYFNNLRSIARQTSYDIDVQFHALKMENELGIFNFSELDEQLSGVPGWSIDMGAAEEAIKMRTSDALKNRPIGGKVTVRIADSVRAQWHMHSRRFPLEAIKTAGVNFGPQDILFGVRYVVTKRTPT